MAKDKVSSVIEALALLGRKLDPTRVEAQDASNSRLSCSCASSLVSVAASCCGAEYGCTNAAAASIERSAMVKALMVVDTLIIVRVALANNEEVSASESGNILPIPTWIGPQIARQLNYRAERGDDVPHITAYCQCMQLHTYRPDDSSSSPTSKFFTSASC